MNIEVIKSGRDAAFAGTIWFDEYVQMLSREGVYCVGLDLVKHEHVYYGEGNETFTYALPAGWRYQIARQFDVEKVKEAIAATDSQKLKPHQFYQQISPAGVAHCRLFVRSNRLFYIGLDGDYYLEQW